MKEDPHSSIYKHSDNLLVTPLHLNPFPFIYLLTYTSIILLPTTTIIHPPPPLSYYAACIYIFSPDLSLPTSFLLSISPLYLTFYLTLHIPILITSRDISFKTSYCWWPIPTHFFYYFINLSISHLFYYNTLSLLVIISYKPPYTRYPHFFFLK